MDRVVPGEENVITRLGKAVAREIPEWGLNLQHAWGAVAELRAGSESVVYDPITGGNKFYCLSKVQLEQRSTI